MNGKKTSICVFGDSISWGAWDIEKGGWFSRLWAHIAEERAGDYTDIYNLSISGGTTETILARFENEAKTREGDALIFQTGANDAGYRSKPENMVVSKEKFKENILEIIKRGKKITDSIAFIFVKNCDEEKTMPVPWDDYYYSNKNMQEYFNIMKDVCEKNSIPFIGIESLEESDFDDGLHPNGIGHEKIFLRVKSFLLEKSWI